MAEANFSSTFFPTMLTCPLQRNVYGNFGRARDASAEQDGASKGAKLNVFGQRRARTFISCFKKIARGALSVVVHAIDAVLESFQLIARSLCPSSVGARTCTVRSRALSRASSCLHRRDDAPLSMIEDVPRRAVSPWRLSGCQLLWPLSLSPLVVAPGGWRLGSSVGRDLRLREDKSKLKSIKYIKRVAGRHSIASRL